MRDTVRVAVVGLGGMGRGHLAVLAELRPWVEVAAVSDVSAEALASVADRLPGVPAYDDPLACVTGADVDAVVVASSDASHAALVLACLERGLPVLCEKPLTTSVADSWAVVERERAAGRRLVQVGFMRRFDPDYRWLHAALTAGEVGEPMVVSHRNHNPASAVRFDAATLVSSSATHDIDLTRWLLGEEPCQVGCDVVASADGSALAVRLTLQTGSGALAVSDIGNGPGLPYDIGTEVVGSVGVLRTGTPAAVTRPVRGAAAATHLPADWLSRFAAAYSAQAVGWLRSLRTGEPVGAGALDGWANNVVVAAALEALRTGGRVPVELLAKGL